MFKLSVSEIIKRPPADVFDTAADPHKQLEWDPDTLKSVEKLTTGPLALGSRYRGDFKGFGVVEYEFVEYERPRRFAHRAPMKMGEMHHIFTFEPVTEGTRMTQEGILKPNLLGRLAWPLMAGMLRKRFSLIVDEVTQYLATTPRTGEAPATPQ